jgi:hypothetical protein
MAAYELLISDVRPLDLVNPIGRKIIDERLYSRERLFLSKYR